MMDKTNILLDLRLLRDLDEFSDSEAGALFKAIVKYKSDGGKASINDRALRLLYNQCVTFIEENESKYQAKCEKLRENASKRYKSMQMDANATKSNQIGSDMICNDMECSDMKCSDVICNDFFVTKKRGGKTKNLENRREAFKAECIEKLSPLCKSDRDKDILGEFFDYYTQTGNGDNAGTMLFEQFPAWDTVFRFKKYLNNGKKS